MHIAYLRALFFQIQFLYLLSILFYFHFDFGNYFDSFFHLKTGIATPQTTTIYFELNNHDLFVFFYYTNNIHSLLPYYFHHLITFLPFSPNLTAPFFACYCHVVVKFSFAPQSSILILPLFANEKGVGRLFFFCFFFSRPYITSNDMIIDRSPIV